MALAGAFSTYSQEQLGMRLERRAGLYAMDINPAVAAFNPASWEVSLFSADFFANQNYGRVLNSSVPKIIRQPEYLVLLEDLAENPDIPTAEALSVDFYKKGRAFGVLQSRVAGPGFLMRLNSRHAVGLSASGRFHTSIYRVPEVLRYESVSAFDYGQTYRIPPVKFATMAWGEIAAHYVYRNFDGDVLFSAGITPKITTGIQGGYGNIDATFDYTPVASDTTQFGSGNWDFGYTNDLVYANDPANWRPRVNGYGAGMDLGFSWAMPAEDGAKAEDYLWRVGISVNDLGFVRYNRNAEQHQINFSNATIVPGDTIASAANISPETAVKEVSRILLGDPNASLVDNRFAIGLPTTISLQADYAFTPALYVSAVATHRIPLLRYNLRTPNTLALVPRFERRWVSVSVPVLLSDYQSPRVGLGVRLGYLYLGSDDLGSWVGRKSLTGTDMYIGLKIHAFDLKKRKKSHSGRSRGGLRTKDRHWKDVGCFNQ